MEGGREGQVCGADSLGCEPMALGAELGEEIRYSGGRVEVRSGATIRMGTGEYSAEEREWGADPPSQSTSKLHPRRHARLSPPSPGTGIPRSSTPTPLPRPAPSSLPRSKPLLPPSLPPQSPGSTSSATATLATSSTSSTPRSVPAPLDKSKAARPRIAKRRR